MQTEIIAPAELCQSWLIIQTQGASYVNHYNFQGIV